MQESQHGAPRRFGYMLGGGYSDTRQSVHKATGYSCMLTHAWHHAKPLRAAEFLSLNAIATWCIDPIHSIEARSLELKLVSVILPTLNEPFLEDSIHQLAKCFRRIPSYRFEVIIVDDSHPKIHQKRVQEVVQRIPKALVPVQVIRGDKKGKGSAVQRGIRECGGDIIFYMDADLTISLEHVEKFIRLLDASVDPSKSSSRGFDVVVAQRVNRKTMDVIRLHPLRFLLSFGLWLAQRFWIFQAPLFRDTQCGFKAFRGDVLKKIASKQVVTGGMFDIEYLYIAVKNRLKIAKRNVDVLPENRKSTIRVLLCLWNDPVSLLKVKLLGILGHYHLKASPRVVVQRQDVA
jgi:glycosyltransferase involved in cell wall biosynthesis